MSAESTERNEHVLRVIKRRFRGWRGRRPYWAGLFTMMGGVPIAYLPYADMRLGNMTIAMATTAGAGSLIIGVLLITLGLTMWFHSIVRVFAGVAAIILALVSLPVSNIGGFLIGFLFSMLGGALSISWVPDKTGPKGDAEQSGPEAAPDPEGDAVHPAQPGHHADQGYDGYAGEGYAGDGYDPNVTETTAQANGGRNSAG